MEGTKYEVARKLVVVQWTPSIVIEKIAEDKKEQKITTIVGSQSQYERQIVGLQENIQILMNQYLLDKK
jgi:conjugal transfer/entry exclusion protein